MDKIIVTLITAYLGYQLGRKLKLPAPAMIGSMLLVGIMNIIFGYAYFPKLIKVFTQAIAGAYIGQSIYRKDIKNIKYLWKALVLLLFILSVNTILVGFLMNHFFNVDLVTALLASVAGGVTDISLISIDMGAQTSTVALLQMSRLLIVMVTFPFWITWFTRNEKTVLNDKISDQKEVINNRVNDYLNSVLKNDQIKIVFTVMIALIAGIIGYYLSIPAGVLIFSIAFITLFNCTTNCVIVPLKLKTLAQLLAGSLVGSTINYETFLNLKNLIGPCVILITSYVIVNIIYSLICKKYNLLDLKSAMFASCPAGGSDIALIAADLGADMVKIAIIQAIRMVYVIAVMPQIIALIVKIVVRS